MEDSKAIPPEELHFFYFTLEKAPDAVFWIDTRANIYRVNEAACRQLGYSRNELTTLTVFEIDPNYNPGNWAEIIEKVKQEGVMTFESRHRTKTGKILPVEITSNYFKFNGEDYFCAFVRDISHHKLIEKMLQEQSENQLELFFSQSLDGFFFMMLDERVRWDDTIDKDEVLDYVFAHQRITKVNDAMLAQYGASREEFLGLTPADFFAHDIDYGKRIWREFFDAGRLHIETEERKFDGTLMWVEGDYICFYDDQARITGHFGIQRDITARKEAAQQQARLQQKIEQHATELEKRVAERTADLAESEARLRAVAEALPDLVFLLNEDGRHLEVMTSQENLLYRSTAEIKGRLLHEIFPEDIANRFLNFVQQTIKSGTVELIEYELPIAGVMRYYEARTAPLAHQINGKRCVVWVARDITDRKRAKELQSQNVYLQEQIHSEHNFGEIIGASKEMKTVFKHIEMVAGTDSTVLLTGETGTGKELIARAIHNRSSRKDHLMIKVNCGAMPAGLVESELFGHEKGAFTGATSQKQGKFELANNGTIFLDEVGELPFNAQVKLLRVLQEQEFERVGGSKTIKVNVRVIAATNRDLQKEVQRSTFRTDLFFRLNIFPIHVPPLREREGDIPLLVNRFIDTFSRQMGKRIKGINQKALDKLTHYHWPGNVRELANILERAAILCQGRVLQEEHIGRLDSEPVHSSENFPSLEEVERRHILAALEKTGGVLAGPKGAATILGVNRSTLWSRMRKLGINISKQAIGS